MAAYTTSQSGNWNDAATWGGGGYPQAGDTWTIATGHTVTIPAATTSTGDAGTFNNGTGKLIVIGTWNLNGNVTMGGGTNIIQADPGAIIDLNGFNIVQNTTGVAYNFIGNSSSRVTVRSTGTAGQVTISGVTTVTPTFRYVDFNGIGDAAWGRLNATNGPVECTNCTFTNCGLIYLDVTGTSNSASYIVDDNEFINPSSATPETSSKWQPYIFNNSTAPTARRSFARNKYSTNGSQNNVAYFRVHSLIIKDNVFDGVKITSLTNVCYWLNNFFKNNIAGDASQFMSETAGNNEFGTLVGNYCLYEGNFHPFGYRNGSATHTSYGNVFDNWTNPSVNAVAADWFCIGTVAGVNVISKNDLVLGGGCQLATAQNISTTTSLQCIRSTRYGTNDGQIASLDNPFAPFHYTEQAGTTPSGATVKVISNLYINPDTATYDWDALIALINTTNDQVDQADYNVTWGYPGGAYVASAYGRYNDVNYTSGSPGTNDDDIDPQFVERGRTCLDWVVDRGYGTATVADVVTAVKADTSRIKDLVWYVFEGYMPTNSAVRTVAHDGGLVGAANYRNTAQDTSTIASLISSAESDYGVSVSSPF